MIIKKRDFIIILLLLFVCVFLISCDNNKKITTEYPAETQNSLSFRITWKDYSGRGETIQKIVDLYNEEYNDGSMIYLVNGDEDRENIEVILKKNNSDMIYVMPYRYVKYFSDKGYLVDLSTSFEEEKQLFYPKLWELGSVNGETYGIPWLGHSICLLYNKTLLKEAGIDGSSIKSQESLLKAIEAVETKTNAKGIGLVGANYNDVSWMVNQFIYGYGSNLVNEDGTKVTINNQNSKNALEFYKNMLGAHAQSTWIDDTGLDVMKYFRKQQIAFEFQGIWGATDVEKNGSLFEVGVIPLDDINLCSEVGPMMLSIPKSISNEKKEEAIEFIRFLISKQAQEKIMDGEYSPEHDKYYPFRTPIRKDMSDSLIFQNKPEYLSFLKGFSNPSIDVPVPKWQTIKDEYYEPGLHKVMKGEITIDEFLKMIETEGNAILMGK